MRVHAIRDSLASSLGTLRVPEIIALTIHHVTKLFITRHLCFTTVIVTEIMVVALMSKASQVVSHSINAGPQRRWTTTIGCSWVPSNSAIREDVDSSKVGKIVLIVVFQGGGVQLST
jgi:hypothetical protein